MGCARTYVNTAGLRLNGGVLLGVAASQILSAIVYQASAQDPFVLVAVALTVLITGSLSVVGPVRRALRVDPARLLREE